MVIGRGRRREHPKNTSKGSRDFRSLQVLRNFRLRTLKGTPKVSSDLRSHPVAMLLLLRKKRGKKPGMRRTYFRICHLPVTWLWADMAHLPVAHAHNILPNRVTSGHVTDVTSGHVTSGSTTSNDNLSVPIYYLYEALKWPQIAPFCISAGDRPRHTPVQNYGVHFIKPQLRPCQTSVVQVFQKLVCLQPLTDPTSY